MDLNRKTAYVVLLEIEKNNAYSNLELNRQIGELKPDNPAFVRELVYGVVEQKMYLDYLLNSLINRGFAKMKKPVLVLLRMGLYQKLFMDSVPDYAAVSETVKMAKKLAPGRERFINGVLRGYDRKKDELKLPDREKDPAGYLSVCYSFDPWIVNLWICQYGEERAEALLSASNQRPRVSIRVNFLKNSRAELAEKLKALGFETEEGTLSERILFVAGSGLLETDLYKEGCFSVQDEASILAAELLGPEAGEQVLDICAAPGGKSLAMAEIMQNKGQIQSFDIYRHKLNLMEKEAARLGLTNIVLSENDGTIENGALLGSADKVLVDGPCSGLGIIRRKPEIKYKRLADAGRDLAEKQLQILSVSSRYVKPGGRLLYSTCTINEIENTAVMNKFLQENEEFTLMEVRRLFPDTEETDGFFFCLMERKACGKEI